MDQSTCVELCCVPTCTYVLTLQLCTHSSDLDTDRMREWWLLITIQYNVDAEFWMGESALASKVSWLARCPDWQGVLTGKVSWLVRYPHWQGVLINVVPEKLFLTIGMNHQLTRFGQLHLCKGSIQWQSIRALQRNTSHYYMVYTCIYTPLRIRSNHMH